MNFEQAIAQLHDTLVVIKDVQLRQAEARKPQTGALDALRTQMIKGYKLHQKRMAHIKQNLSEIDEKLNRLTGRQH